MLRKVKVCYNVTPVSRGNVVEDVIRLKRDENGNCIYVKDGKRNISNDVASFEKGCSLNFILERVSLLPTREKIGYLNQTENGVFADMTMIPKDGTEAFLMLDKLKSDFPDVYNRFANGESFADIIKSVLPTENNDNKESEVNNSNEN